MSAVQVNSEQRSIVERKPSTSDSSSDLKQSNTAEVEKGAEQEVAEETKEHSWTSAQLRTPPSFHLGRHRVVNPRLVDFIDHPPSNPSQMVRVSNITPHPDLSLSPAGFPRIVQTFWAWTFIL